MFEYSIYPAIGSIIAVFGLETAWHFTACDIPDMKIKACIYRRLKSALAST